MRPGPAGVRVRGLTWRPPGGGPAVLDGVDLDLDPGERVLLAGPSGAGKSTLLRALAGLIETVDAGELTGTVHLDGRDVGPGRVGLVMQEPGDAVVAARVGRDVAFGPENLGLPREQIWHQVHGALDAVGFPYGVEHPTGALSGGELQRLALAGALAWAPGLLLLDEPTSMLDPDATAQVRDAVRAAVADRSVTLVVVDHDLAGWVDLVDRLVVLDPHGRIVADGPVARLLPPAGRRAGAGRTAGAMPPAPPPPDWARLGLWVPGQPPPSPLPVPDELVAPLVGPLAPHPVAGPAPARPVPAGTAPADGAHPALLAATGLVVTRRSGGPLRGRWATTALRGVSVGVTAGALTALVGPSGAGKSTLVEALAGLIRPDQGRVEAAPTLAAGTRGGQRQPARWRSLELAARIGWVPQRPEHAVVTHRVADEVAVTARRLARPDTRRGDALLEVLGIAHLAEADPLRLSGGEARRLALAAALAHGPAVLALDEPTVGQDRATWAAVAGLLLAARRAGVGVVLATHDARLVARLAPDQLCRLQAGRTVPDPARPGAGADARPGPDADGAPPRPRHVEVTGGRD
jgi:energy-coupling factor transport system ATP-binding protein